MKDLVLASASPRRSEILKKCGYNFIIAPSYVKETDDKSLKAEEVALYNAKIKAEDVFNKYGKVTLGADTVVVIDGDILGKPKDKAEHAGFLRRLSGRAHVVITAYCVISDKGERVCGYDRSTVVFNALTEDKIDAYVESGCGADKAGGYGIQDGYGLVAEIKGEYETVVGLPIKKISVILERFL